MRLGGSIVLGYITEKYVLGHDMASEVWLLLGSAPYSASHHHPMLRTITLDLEVALPTYIKTASPGTAAGELSM
jgi:hypothetical protein